MAGGDNMADAALAVYSVLFHLWRKTGIVPYYTNIRPENATCSLSTGCKMDLSRLKIRLDELTGPKQPFHGYRIRYQPAKFPGLLSLFPTSRRVLTLVSLLRKGSRW